MARVSLDIARAVVQRIGISSKIYNLSQRAIELEVMPALRHFRIGLIPWSPIGMGLLGGVLGKISEGRRARLASSQSGRVRRDQWAADRGAASTEPESAIPLALKRNLDEAG